MSNSECSRLCPVALICQDQVDNQELTLRSQQELSLVSYEYMQLNELLTQRLDQQTDPFVRRACEKVIDKQATAMRKLADTMDKLDQDQAAIQKIPVDEVQLVAKCAYKHPYRAHIGEQLVRVCASLAIDDDTRLAHQQIIG